MLVTKKKKIFPYWVFDILFFSFLFIFFSQFYNFHLHYREQLQLFLFSNDYIKSYACFPGGISDYIGNFITQFFFYSNVGAILLAGLFLLLQKIYWFLLSKITTQTTLYPLSFIPPLWYCSLLCDENYLIGGLIAIIIGSCFCLLSFSYIRHPQKKWSVPLFIPIIYWITGGMVFFYTLFVILTTSAKKIKNIHYIGFPMLIIAETILLPFIAKHYIIQYPLIKFFSGVNFYRFPNSIPVAVGMLAFIMSILPFLLRIKRVHVKKEWSVFLFVFIILSGGAIIFKNADFKKEDIMAYDFYARMRKWDKIIARAEKIAPDSPLSVSCLNLALAKEKKLADKIFHYYQNGSQGLIPSFQKDFTIPLVSGEIYYQLGFINTSQRYSFEAMQSLPLYQQSVRVIKRQVECNLIKGNKKLAIKYLSLLKETFFYNKWATAMSALIEDDSKILRHDEYGWLKSHSIKHDFFFSDGEKDMMLGLLLTDYADNRMAYEYLMCYYLLNKDLNNFLKYIFLGKNINYKHLPISFQEAIAYVMMNPSYQADKNLLNMVSPEIRKRSVEFMHEYKSTSNTDKLKNRYGHTYWYYLLPEKR